MAAPDARQVGVAGSFNDWNPNKHLLKKKPGGFWEKTVMLAPGRYEYKYVVDGRWCLDPSNTSTCDNGFGSGNSVIKVHAAKGPLKTSLRTLPAVRRPPAGSDAPAAP
mgnify:CR=1 FL=1